MDIADRLDELARNLRTLPKQLARVTDQVLDDNAAELELENQEQLAAGLDATGQRIEPPYTGTTREIKKKKGQPTDRVTLKDRGDFYRSIVAKVRGGELDVAATDSKTTELEEKYGPDIVGLSEEAIDDFRENLVRPELEYQTRNILGL